MKKIIRHAGRKIHDLILKSAKPQVLKKVVVSGSMAPRQSLSEINKTVLSFNGTDDDIFGKIYAAGNTIFKEFEINHRVLIKINLNTDKPYPASTDPVVLSAILDMLIERGIKNISVGDCSSISALPTRRVFEKTGILEAIKNKAKIICFDEDKWVHVPVNGKYLNHITVPQAIYNADKIIYLANLKTHQLADFSMSIKLAIGFMHPLERYDLHKSNLHEKIPEAASAVIPDLIFLDAREPFITCGPNEGCTAKGETIFVGTDMLSVDMKGYDLLLKLKELNGCKENFSDEYKYMKQFSHAIEIFRNGQPS